MDIHKKRFFIRLSFLGIILTLGSVAIYGNYTGWDFLVAECKADNIEIEGVFSTTTTDALEGSIGFINRGTFPCELEGYPEVRIEDANGQDVAFDYRQLVLDIDKDIKDRTIYENKKSTAPIRFENWCLEIGEELPYFLYIDIPDENETRELEILLEEEDVKNEMASSPICSEELEDFRTIYESPIVPEEARY